MGTKKNSNINESNEPWVLFRKLSHSTEKIPHSKEISHDYNQQQLNKNHAHNNSSESLGTGKQRRSRT
jgi:hypothetical protein